jgi:hypothetical protein
MSINSWKQDRRTNKMESVLLYYPTSRANGDVKVMVKKNRYCWYIYYYMRVTVTYKFIAQYIIKSWE